MDLQNIGSSKALQCPRCDSFHTKFCYYNNYNYSQPRHFCKSCRRYWTIGGVLRNVPVGGGTRKSKISKPKPKPMSDVLSPSLLLAGANSNSNSNSRSDFEILMGNCWSERSSVPFALELNQLGDWYGARGEGFGSLDLSRTGESEIPVPGSIESRR